MKTQLDNPKFPCPVWEHEPEKFGCSHRTWINLGQDHTLSFWQGNEDWMLMTGLVTVVISAREALDILKTHRPISIDIFPKSLTWKDYVAPKPPECLLCRTSATIAKRFCQACYDELAGIDRCADCAEIASKCRCEGDRNCSLCAGTGIGQHGDPDTSKCTVCGGRGYFDAEPEQERDYYQEMKDEKLEREFQQEEMHYAGDD